MGPGFRREDNILLILSRFDPHPIRSERHQRCGVGHERSARFDRLQAQEGEALAVAARSDLAGVAAFHAGLTTSTPAAPGKVKAKVLVQNGADDPFIKPDSVEAFEKEMVLAKAH